MPESENLPAFEEELFDPDDGRDLILEAEDLPKAGPPFIMVPKTWAERLYKTERPTAIKLALFLLDNRFQKKDGRITNFALAEVGISRMQKSRALRELETLGLIKVRHPRHGANPRIAFLLCK